MYAIKERDFHGIFDIQFSKTTPKTSVQRGGLCKGHSTLMMCRTQGRSLSKC